MERKSVNRFLLRAGFTLVLLALFTGLMVPMFRNPRMGLSAHLEGVLNGLLLVILGLAWPHFRLTEARGRLLERLGLYATYVNWGATVLSAAWGTIGLTPMAGAGFHGAPWQEFVSTVLAVSVALSAVAAVAIAASALGGADPADSGA